MLNHCFNMPVLCLQSFLAQFSLHVLAFHNIHKPWHNMRDILLWHNTAYCAIDVVNGYVVPEIHNGSIHSVETVVLWSAVASCHLLEHCKTPSCVGRTNQGLACKKAKTLKLPFRHIRLQHLSRGYLSVSLLPRAPSNLQPAYCTRGYVLCTLFCGKPFPLLSRTKHHSISDLKYWAGRCSCPLGTTVFQKLKFERVFLKFPVVLFFWTTTGHKSGSSGFFSAKNTEQHLPNKAQKEFG